MLYVHLIILLAFLGVFVLELCTAQTKYGTFKKNFIGLLYGDIHIWSNWVLENLRMKAG